MTRDDVDVLFDRIMLYYPNFEAFPARVDEWHRVLADQDAQEVDRNLTEYTKSNPWPPTPADLITKKTENLAVLAGDSALREMDEWDKTAVPPPKEALELLDRLRRETHARD